MAFANLYRKKSPFHFKQLRMVLKTMEPDYHSSKHLMRKKSSLLLPSAQKTRQIPKVSAVIETKLSYLLCFNPCLPIQADHN